MSKNIFHILVVDDDDRIRELVKQYLIDNQFLVTTAKDAIEAKKKIEIIKFDILILDIMRVFFLIVLVQLQLLLKLDLNLMEVKQVQQQGL